MADQEPRKRGAAPLAGREVAERQMARCAEPDRVERDLDGRAAGSPRKAPPEARFSATVSAGLQRVEVAEIVAAAATERPFAAAPSSRTLPPRAAAARRGCAAARFAGAVRAGDDQRLAGPRSKPMPENSVSPPRPPLSHSAISRIVSPGGCAATPPAASQQICRSAVWNSSTKFSMTGTTMPAVGVATEFAPNQRASASAGLPGNGQRK